MTPIEKSRAQDCALQVLRVKRQAVREDIKTAWRQRVLETHPDRNSGDDTQFQLVQAAYQVANGTASKDAMELLLDLAEPDEPEIAQMQASQPRRARMKTRMVFFDQDHEPQQTAQKKIETVQIDPGNIQYVDATAVQEGSSIGQSQDVHRVQRVRQKGRRVSYIIWSSVLPGPNEVAVPTGDFRLAGGSKEVALQFASAAEGPVTISIPDAQRAAHFPGAQSVRVHFSHGADTRP